MLSAKSQLHLHNIWSRNIFPFSMEGCVLYLPLWQEDMQGSTMFSYEPYHRSGTVTEAVRGITGRTFDGSDDNILLNANVTKGLTAVTALFWVRPTDISLTMSVFGDYTGSADVSLIMQLQDVGATGTFTTRCAIKGDAQAIATVDGTSTTWPYATWQLLAFSWGSNLVSFYHNGVPDGTGAYADTALETTVTLNTFIGAYASGITGGNFKGIIGEGIFFNRILTAPENLHIYDVTKWRY